MTVDFIESTVVQQSGDGEQLYVDVFLNKQAV